MKLFTFVLDMDGEDGNGLKVENIGQFFQVLTLCFEKIATKLLWFALQAKFHLISSSVPQMCDLIINARICGNVSSLVGFDSAIF